MALNLHRRPHLVHDYLPLAAAITYPKCQRFPRQIRTLHKFLSPHKNSLPSNTSLCSRRISLSGGEKWQRKYICLGRLKNSLQCCISPKLISGSLHQFFIKTSNNQRLRSAGNNDWTFKRRQTLMLECCAFGYVSLDRWSKHAWSDYAG